MKVSPHKSHLTVFISFDFFPFRLLDSTLSTLSSGLFSLLPRMARSVSEGLTNSRGDSGRDGGDECGGDDCGGAVTGE